MASVDSIDLIDSVGSHIRYQLCNDSIIRILPVKNDLVNQDWITDKTRFCLDAFEESSVSEPIASENNMSLLLGLAGRTSDSSFNTQFILGSQLSLENL